MLESFKKNCVKTVLKFRSLLHNRQWRIKMAAPMIAGRPVPQVDIEFQDDECCEVTQNTWWIQLICVGNVPDMFLEPEKNCFGGINLPVYQIWRGVWLRDQNKKILQNEFFPWNHRHLKFFWQWNPVSEVVPSILVCFETFGAHRVVVMNFFSKLDFAPAWFESANFGGENS